MTKAVFFLPLYSSIQQTKCNQNKTSDSLLLIFFIDQSVLSPVILFWYYLNLFSPFLLCNLSFIERTFFSYVTPPPTPFVYRSIFTITKTNWINAEPSSFLYTFIPEEKKNISFGKHPVYMPSVVHSSIFSKSYPPPLEHSTRRPSIRISTHLILKTSISVFLYRIAKSIFSLVEHYQQKFPVNLHFHQQKTSTKLSWLANKDGMKTGVVSR